MSYLVLARKWRPQGFDDLIGQEPVATILKNSITQGKVAHAYIFSGPRGVGKTSAARILAKALNCEKGPTSYPCGTCPFCASIAEGSSVDVMEIDGASNNSVNDIRDLRERVKYAPSAGRFKVYIIDESHMLSDSAFNALLKTIEEPPPHVIFVLATTAPKKIPLTVMSRCQHLPLRRIPAQKIRERLKTITGSESIKITEQAIEIIASSADGSMRDSLTILDQAASFSEEITGSSIKDLLGLTDFKTLYALAEAVTGGMSGMILDIISGMAERGTDFKAFSKDLLKFFRDLLVAKLVSAPEEVLDLNEEEIKKLKDIASGISEDHLSLYLGEMIKAEQDVRSAFSPRLSLEIALIRASYLSTLKPVKEAIKDIEALARQLSGQYGEEKRQVQKPEPVPEHVPEQATGDIQPLGSDSLLKLISDKVEDPRIASKLSHATAELSEDTLTLTFNSSEAELFAEPIRENTALIESIALNVARKPIKIQVSVKKSKGSRKKTARDKMLSEPVIKEALELFEGRVVDIRSVNE